MAFVPPARHLLRAKDLADARYPDPLTVDDLVALIAQESGETTTSRLNPETAA